MDIGARFGLAGWRVFSPWEPEVSIPDTIDRVRDEIEDQDFVILGGGGDIHPSLYGQSVAGAFVGRTPSFRDNFEVLVFREAIRHKKPVFGICRGAQMLCALNGGQLYQNVTHHTSSHEIHTSNGEVYYSTSVHHQMMCPKNIKHELIAWANQLSDRYDFDPKAKLPKTVLQEPEIIYFTETNSLGVQGHPEFVGDVTDPFVVYCRKLVAKKLLNNPSLES